MKKTNPINDEMLKTLRESIKNSGVQDVTEDMVMDIISIFFENRDKIHAYNELEKYINNTFKKDDVSN